MRPVVRTLLLDIGGVLLTNGWDHGARRRAAVAFKLERSEMEARHSLMFQSYEEGKLTSDEYLDHVVFYRKRPFTRARFRRFMFEQSRPYPEMIQLITRLKRRHGLKTVVLSNEARELNAYRIRKFRLNEFVDFFISSCFVGLRKPDPGIFRMALDVAQTPVREVAYVENTPVFVDVAKSMGVRGILHTDYRLTRDKLSAIGLRPDDASVPENET